MNRLYVVMGIPASGKSSWIANHINVNKDKSVSRDDIRFALVRENEEYFSREKEVFTQFVKDINLGLAQGYNVFADATHLNEGSRNKLLRNIKFASIEADCIWIKTSLEEALRRNENRVNTRAYVPRDTIFNMDNSLTSPSFEEGFSRIYIIEPNKKIVCLEEKN